MQKPRPRVKLPKSVSKGVPFTVRTRITHPMHTGLRHGRDGKPVPRRIINRFAVRYNGEEAISVDLERAVSADPYFSFEMAVQESGDVEFEWVDDDGSVYRVNRRVEVKS
ncbi:MAG: thiosulfate oxidation carrier complex protein SoxZ [Deltaproteobacteria bacterium]|nr:thiosulfate oxidation carrier complex protein SoxZ [Deltaproteobacteria bacterium]